MIEGPIARNEQKLLYDEVRLGSDTVYQPGRWRDMPEIIHDEHVIKGFFGEYRWLSNFGPAAIRLDGAEYTSVECAYQAAKWAPEDRAYFQSCTNKDSIVYNRTHTPNGYHPDGWDSLKVDIMHFLLEQKFHYDLNPDNYEKLLATGDRYIEETNWWNDTFWGRNFEGIGENNLGQLLMGIRSELYSDGIKPTASPSVIL